jgi:tetratricopeptide (TPR) repeat protein
MSFLLTLALHVFVQHGCAMPNPSALISLVEESGARQTPPIPIGISENGSEHRVHTPFELPPADESWVRLITPRFDIISSAGDRRTREMAGDLETLAAALPVNGGQAPSPVRTGEPPVVHTRVFIFMRRRDAQPYFDFLVNRDKSEVAGVFIAENNRGAMLIDESRGPLRDRTPYHELVHYLIGTASPRPPIWLEEGLAEYYSSAEVHGGIIHVGGQIPGHMELLRRRGPIPVDVLFNAGFESDVRLTPLFYAESWATVDWMMLHDPAKLQALMRDVSAGMSSADALQKHFNKTPAELQRFITTFAASALPDLPTTLKVPLPEIAGNATPMTRADVLYEFGRFLQEFEGTKAQAAQLLRAAVEANPKHARALAALGEFDRAIAADPADGQVFLEYAEKLLGNEIGPLAESVDLDPADAPRFRQARELAQKALDLHADRARALGALGASYAIEPDPAPGIAPLETALLLAPNRNDYALHLLAFYRRVGLPPPLASVPGGAPAPLPAPAAQGGGATQKADTLFAKLIAGGDKQVGFAARAIVVRTELVRINALVKEQKLDEAAALLRRLSASTSDPVARQQMDDQAKQLETNAAANREIIAYNHAVQLYNDRDLRGAQKIIDALVATATDSKVIADATKLQTLIHERLKHR